MGVMCFGIAVGRYVVFEAPNDYAASCFKQYGLPTDSTGQFAVMYKPFHLIGSVVYIGPSAALRNEPTTVPRNARNGGFYRKTRLSAGEVLDGEGGYTVWGQRCP